MCEDEDDDKLYPNNFWRIVSSRSKTLFSAMNVTMAISINCEIEINISIHVPALLSACQNSYEIIFIVNFISLFYRYHRGYVRLL